jgi:hypothetical protein
MLLLLVAGLPRPAAAEEPLLTVMKNTLLGAATGLILGGTLTLVVEDDSRSEVIRWGVVVGTFGGFALGTALAWRGEEDLFPDTYGDAGAGRPPAALRPTRATLLACRAARQLERRALDAPARPPEAPARLRVALLRFAG